MLHTSGIPRLSYHAEGKGPLVIMLHGLLMDRKSWKDSGLISVLSPFFHIVCPDLIGHGESEKTNVEEFYTQQKQALSIVKIMDELGYKKRMLSVTPLERGWLWAGVSGTRMQTKSLASASKKEWVGSGQKGAVRKAIGTEKQSQLLLAALKEEVVKLLVSRKILTARTPADFPDRIPQVTSVCVGDAYRGVKLTDSGLNEISAVKPGCRRE